MNIFHVSTYLEHKGGAEESMLELADALEERGHRAVNPAMGFPMEMDRFPGKIWVVSHKRVAEAAGLGKMGIHRNLIHPRFGNFILLGTVLTDAVVEHQHDPLDFNPCLECKLCVAACPAGAIAPAGYFNFSACYTHNYREFMGGFTDWIENVADSRSARDYRSRVSDAESSSWWQSLSFGANYKAAYCMSVCPAGEDVIGPYLADKAQHLEDVVKPLQKKEEIVYVLPESDAEEHVAKRFKKKAVALITDMNEPLGETVGNSIEVVEAIHALKGKAPHDLMEVTMALAERMLVLGKKAKTPKEAEKKLKKAIESGKAIDKFVEMVKRQGGDPKVIYDFGLLPWAKFRLLVNSDRRGYVQSIDTRKIGLCAVRLGSGREKLESQIDHGAGMLIKKKVEGK